MKDKMAVHYSAKTPIWETPQDLFDQLNSEFRFDLDPCALPENAKCELYFTPKEDGLSQSWDGHHVFMNPPYGREISKWVKKAAESKALVVCLLPARTDTRWFHDYVYKKTEIRFVKGRLKFGGASENAPFPNMIVIFNPNKPKKIYLAGPYSHPEEALRLKRFEQLNGIAADIMSKGDFVYSPISHTHPIAAAGKLPLGWEFWEKYDTTFIEWADEVHVAMLDGWELSKGVQAEISIAKALNKTIRYIEVQI
jgi:site-specific DNA-methyltransferase (adenine-specific)